MDQGTDMWWKEPDVSDHLKPNLLINKFFNDFWQFFLQEHVYGLKLIIISFEDIFLREGPKCHI